MGRGTYQMRDPSGMFTKVGRRRFVPSVVAVGGKLPAVARPRRAGAEHGRESDLIEYIELHVRGIKPGCLTVHVVGCFRDSSVI